MEGHFIVKAEEIRSIQETDDPTNVINDELYDEKKVKGVAEKVSLREQQSACHHLIKNYEIKIRGKWVFPCLPLATKEYFICHEGENTIIGARLQFGKSRKEMTKLLIDLQQGISTEIPAMSHLKVDYKPILDSKPRWGSITSCHLPTLETAHTLKKKRLKRVCPEREKVPDVDASLHCVIKYFNAERLPNV